MEVNIQLVVERKDRYIAKFNKAINADIDEINKSNDLLEVN